MANSITFYDKTEADEYVSEIEKAGFVANVDKSDGKYVIRIVGKSKASNNGFQGNTLVSATKMLGRGIRDIGESLGTPSTNRRPRIAQLPESRSRIAIAHQPNLERLKATGLRGKFLSFTKKGGL